MNKFNLTEEQIKKLQDFINGDIRFRGMSIHDAEELAWKIMFSAKANAMNFLENLSSDVKMMVDDFKNSKLRR